jgi:hypothetical protein
VEKAKLKVADEQGKRERQDLGADPEVDRSGNDSTEVSDEEKGLEEERGVIAADGTGGRDQVMGKELELEGTYDCAEPGEGV